MNPELLLSRIRVILCRPSHPGNIGAAARAMKTMGLSRLYLVSPKQFPDPEAVTRATGAVNLLEEAKITNTLAEALHDFRNRIEIQGLSDDPLQPYTRRNSHHV